MEDTLAAIVRHPWAFLFLVVAIISIVATWRGQ